MQTVYLNQISSPCWIYNSSISELIACNKGAEVDKQLEEIVAKEKDQIIQSLDKIGHCIFGKEKEYKAYQVKDEVHVLCNAELKNHPNFDRELNKVLKQEKDHHSQTQAILEERNAMLNAIFDSTALFIWTTTGSGKLTSFNRRFKEQMYQWFAREMVEGGQLVVDPFEENISEWVSFQEELGAVLQGEKKNIQLKLHIEGGEQVWVEVYMDPICVNDEIKEVSCIGFEITERKRIDSQIGQSLKEKETLLQEVHHRVKNNLQIISSLLRLQSSFIEDEETLDILTESQNRIKSMSFIHESLYMKNDFTSVDLNDYVKGLSSNLLYSYCLDPSQVELDLDVDKLTLNLDQAIPCGLIINELVSNSFKHAYPNGQKGRLVIRVKEKEGRMAIMIADDGIGIPKSWDPEKSESLGIQLVYTLTEQLDGDIEFSGEKGTKYLITFDRIKPSRKWQ